MDLWHFTISALFLPHHTTFSMLLDFWKINSVIYYLPFILCSSIDASFSYCNRILKLVKRPHMSSSPKDLLRRRSLEKWHGLSMSTHGWIVVEPCRPESGSPYFQLWGFPPFLLPLPPDLILYLMFLTKMKSLSFVVI